MKPQELRDKLGGAVVILITPFNADYRLDEGGLRANLEFLLGKGIHGGIVAGGSLGECYAMSDEERKHLFEVVVETVGDRSPVLCCVNHSGTLLAVDLAQHAEAIGADGIMLLPPYYMAPNEESILTHFRLVSEAIEIGIMVYNNQWISKVDLSLETLEALANLENVVAVKDCTPDFFRFRPAIAHLGERLTILNCMAEFWEPQAYTAGSRGFLTAMGNFVPEVSLQLVEACVARDWERGRTVYQEKLHPYLEVEASVARALGDAETVALYKAAMALRGLAAGPVRPPLYDLPEVYLPPLQKALEEIGIL